MVADQVKRISWIRVYDLRGTFAANLVSAGIPFFTVSEILDHADPATTARHYADLARGVTKEIPTILERYISEQSAGRNANGMRAKILAREAAENGELASARYVKV